MHEAALVQGLLRTALRAVEEHNARPGARRAGRLTRLCCRLGLLSCVEPQSLRACFELFAEGTPAEGAELVLETAPLACRCEDCGATFALERRHFLCPACGGERLQFHGGHGLTLMGIDVEAENTP